MIMFVMSLMLMSCSQNYSNGERIGFVTKFSEKGIFWKSWEGEQNLTQTGMNTSSLFEFSIDNDHPDDAVIATLDSAASKGWKVKLRYHQVYGWNWFSNRGNTDFFITKCEVLSKTPMDFLNGGVVGSAKGKVVDTIFVIVIDPAKVKQYLK